jgi:Nif-specific regulatory protein
MDNAKLDTRENVLERCVVDCEMAVIIHALIKTQGNLSAAARLLGTTIRILTYKVHKYEIDYEQFRCGRNVKENLTI